jgi:hypothetical protein
MSSPLDRERLEQVLADLAWYAGLMPELTEGRYDRTTLADLDNRLLAVQQQVEGLEESLGIALTDRAWGCAASAASVLWPYVPECPLRDWEAGRWQSQPTATAWWQVDLGATFALQWLDLEWHDPYPRQFDVLGGPDGLTWTVLDAGVEGRAGAQRVVLAQPAARYVRLDLRDSSMGAGFALARLRLYGAEVTS